MISMKDVMLKIRKRIPLSIEDRNTISCSRKGIKFSKSHRENLSKSHMGLQVGKKNPRWKPKIVIVCTFCDNTFFVHQCRRNTAKYCSVKCKGSKQREEESGFPIKPNIGMFEEVVLENIEKCLGYKILPQYKIAGYYLDGYCPTLKLGIEVDEPHHNNNCRLEREVNRENIIRNMLGCQFLRIDVPDSIITQ